MEKPLTEVQCQRYARHLNLAEIGPAGQRKLLAGTLAIIGLGGLGSPAALYAAAAGVGHLVLVDGDVVDLSNLQRQIVHGLADVGRPKVESAAETLAALNPDVKLTPVPHKLDASNAAELLGQCDFVIDATDNFAAKFLIADACHHLGRPYSHGGIREFFGQTMTVLPGRTACYRCIFENPPPEGGPPRGPLGPLPGLIGAIQATEAIKFLLGLGDLLTNSLLTYDVLAMTCRKIKLAPNPACPLCMAKSQITP